MARNTETVVVPKFDGCKNRDLGKRFRITEWPAAKSDNWITRVAFAFNQGGGSIPMDLRSIGWEGIAIIGINTFLRGAIKSEEMIPLFDELLECVQIIRDPRHPDVATAIAMDDDIEEVPTRWWLRSEVVRVHVNFSPLDALSRLLASILEKAPTPS
jgi:hypothetical protein